MSERSGPDIDSLKSCVDDVLQRAKSLGATQAEASASFGTGLSVTARLRDVETLEYHRDQGLGVTVYIGRRKGSASTSDLAAAAVRETVEKACALAGYAAEDDCAGLADADVLATDIPDLDLHHPWSLDPEAAIEIAKSCEAAALDLDSRVSNSEGSTVDLHDACRVYGNTHGLLAGYRETQHSISCAVLASDGTTMERDFDYTAARDPSDLVAAGAVGREAAQRALDRLGSRKPPTVVAPVLFPARLARSLFGHLLAAVSGGSLYRRATFLADSLDTSVLADSVSIDERPHIPKGLGSAPYDDEGVATHDRRLIDGGVLKGCVLGSYYARKLGMKTTGNAGGIHNLIVSDTGQSHADLLRGMERGLLLTELIGHGVNGVTGDYSRGAAGFWVENGEIQFPVSEITIAGNLKSMYRGILGIGTDTDLRGVIRTGSVLVDGMTIAGN